MAGGQCGREKDIVRNVADGGQAVYIVLSLNCSVVALPQNHVRYPQ